VDRTGAEGLHVTTARLYETSSLGHRLPEVPASPLVPLPNGFLARPHHVGDRVGIDTGLRQEAPCCVHRARLARQGLEQHAGRQRLVAFMSGRERAEHLAVVVERQVTWTRILLEPDQTELVDLGHQLVERELRENFAERSYRLCGDRV